MPAKASSSKNMLTAQLSDVTTLATLLRTVAFQAHAVITASEHGLEIATELNRSLQAHAYLYSQMFDSYEFAPAASSKRARGGKQSKKQKRQRKEGDANSSSQAEESTQASGADDSLDDEDESALRPEEETDEPPSVSFEVNLQTWISCLDIFGGAGSSRPGHSSSKSGGNYQRGRLVSTVPRAGRDGDEEDELLAGHGSASGKLTSMKLFYEGVGHPLVLELEQDINVVTRCAISTYEASFLTDMSFDPSELVSQAIMPSELLHSAFSEVDQSCKCLSIFISPGRDRRSAMLRFNAISDLGSSEMDFPANSATSNPNGVIEKFVALPESQEQWYSFPLLIKTLSALRSSIKTSIRIDDAGLISFQFMMPKKPSANGGEPRAVAAEQDYAFVEFLCVPLDESIMLG